MGTNDQSILKTVKRTLGLAENYVAYDEEIIIHINSVFGTLQQLGIGPVEGFEIEDDTLTWFDFVQDELILSPVKSYIYLRVRMLWDPPSTNPAVMSSFKEQIKELEWRLEVAGEPFAGETVIVLDGGGA